MEKEAKEKNKKQGVHDTHHLDTIIADMIKERKGEDRAVEIFNSIDADGNGSLDLEEFIDGKSCGLNTHLLTSKSNLTTYLLNTLVQSL